MSKIVLYHGSQEVVRKPLFKHGKVFNDYGQGFYLTENIELAKEWGPLDNSLGYVNEYLLDCKDLKILNLLSSKYNVLNWLAILIDNRKIDLKLPIQMQGKEYILSHFLPNYKDYDLIIGYRADDAYFSFVRYFLNNRITISQLSQAMKLGKLGEQYFLQSEKAFKKISFQNAYKIDDIKYFKNRIKRDEEARSKFNTLINTPDINGLYLIDIIREGITNDDERISR